MTMDAVATSESKAAAGPKQVTLPSGKIATVRPLTRSVVTRMMIAASRIAGTTDVQSSLVAIVAMDLTVRWALRAIQDRNRGDTSPVPVDTENDPVTTPLLGPLLRIDVFDAMGGEDIAAIRRAADQEIDEVERKN